MTRRLAVGLAAVAVAALVLATGSSGGASSAGGDLERIRAVALWFAAREGDAHATDGVVVETNRHAANYLNGRTDIPDLSPVYAVALHGRFTAYDASPPRGQPLPTGHLLVLVLDRKTLRVDDWMVGDVPLDVSRLGTPRTLPLG